MGGEISITCLDLLVGVLDVQSWSTDTTIWQDPRDIFGHWAVLRDEEMITG